MKKLVALILVLGLAAVVNAVPTMTIGVSDLELAPSETAIISITGDDPVGDGQGTFFLGISAGNPGTLDISSASNLYTGSGHTLGLSDDPGTAEFLGVDNPFVNMAFTDLAMPPVALNGLLVDGIVFTCTGAGDVTLNLFDAEGGLLNSVVISQIPEPITLALLGLGGLFIRRK